ncbi:RIP metalloprotease [Candidatus Saccharibacteria bacterium CPR2]|nr:RIP metalloprotease [Candidatus Saccharibacteria bacterium CPR2]
MATLLLVIGLLLFILLIVVHEYGHFLIAKRNSVEVEEFGIGFPPKIAGKTMGKGIFRAYYTINLLPLGGFVRLKGENDADKRQGSFGSASFKVKAKITLAGVAMNLFAAMVILTVLAAVGMPKFIDNQFSIPRDTKVITQRTIASYVEKDSPAEKAGMKYGDEIISIGEKEVKSSDDLFSATEQYAGKDVQIEYKREGNIQIAQVKLNDSNQEQGYLGVAPGDLVLQRSTWSSPIVGIGSALQFAWMTLAGIGQTLANLVSGNTAEAAEGVAGPVGIFALLQNVSVAGLPYVLFFIAIISVTLAVVNFLPIPALDGGRLAVMGIFRLLKKPLTPKTEQAIHGTGMAVLLTLVVVLTVLDVRRFF